MFLAQIPQNFGINFAVFRPYVDEIISEFHETRSSNEISYQAVIFRQLSNFSYTFRQYLIFQKYLILRKQLIFRLYFTSVDRLDSIHSAQVKLYDQVTVEDKSLIWNTDLIEAMELENLLTQGYQQIVAASDGINSGYPPKMMD